MAFGDDIRSRDQAREIIGEEKLAELIEKLTSTHRWRTLAMLYTDKPIPPAVVNAFADMAENFRPMYADVHMANEYGQMLIRTEYPLEDRRGFALDNWRYEAANRIPQPDTGE